MFLNSHAATYTKTEIPTTNKAKRKEEGKLVEGVLDVITNHGLLFGSLRLEGGRDCDMMSFVKS